jgi:hypothetical protein
MPMMGQQGQEGQYVVTEWQDTYQIVPVESSATELPANLDALAVVHPENLDPGAPVRDRPVPARGQAGLPRRRSLVAVFQAPGRPGGDDRRAAAQRLERPARAPRRLGHRLRPQKVVGDNENAEEVELRDGPPCATRSGWASTQDNFNPKALPTAQLELAAGSSRPAASRSSPGTASPSPPGRDLGQGRRLSRRRGAPVRPARRHRPAAHALGQEDDRRLVTGKFKSAFPDGAPKEPAGGRAKKAGTPGPAPAKPARSRSPGPPPP